MTQPPVDPYATPEDPPGEPTQPLGGGDWLTKRPAPAAPPTPPTTPTTPYSNPYEPTPQPAYGQPAYGQPAYGYAPQNHPRATTALVLGLVGLIGTLLCGVGLLVGPVAWYLGASARREIDAEPGRYGGRSEATAGMVMGIITTVLLALAVLAVAVVLVVGVAGTSTTY